MCHGSMAVEVDAMKRAPQYRVIEIRANGMTRRIAVKETDAEIVAKVDALYRDDPRLVLDIWLAIERELCPHRWGAGAAHA